MTRLSVTFCLLDGFSNMVLACLMEPLRALRDGGMADISWRVVTPSGQPGISSSGLSIAPDVPVEGARSCDVLVVLSGYGFRQHANQQTHLALRKLAVRAGALLGADAGAWLLASSGLLTKGRATIHWMELSAFAEAFPSVDVTSDRFIREGRVWSCGGASTALDLMLDLIGERFGTAQAFSASTLFLHDTAREASAGRMVARLSWTSPKPLRRAVADMSATLETPLALSEIARRSGVSERGLFRLFQAELGMPPGRYYQLMRLALARDLTMETDLSQSEIALKTGFGSAASLAKAFRAGFKISLSELRRGQRRRVRG